jgi:hypothetical protein
MDNDMQLDRHIDSRQEGKAAGRQGAYSKQGRQADIQTDMQAILPYTQGRWMNSQFKIPGQRNRDEQEIVEADSRPDR